jgi:tRNA(Ile)-lysidine synthase
MPRLAWRDGLCWARPWLDQPREAIEAYARQQGLHWIDDPSNADPRYARNRLRQRFWPAFPEAEGPLAQAARWAQEAGELAAEVAESDLTALDQPQGLDLSGLMALSPARASNALRAWLAAEMGRAAPASLVARVLTEWQPGATLRWPAPQGQLHAYRGLLQFEPDGPVGGPPKPLDLSRPGLHPQPEWGGAWQVERVAAGGVPLRLLAQLTQRARQGAEQFQSAPGRPARSLKKCFQERGIPGWHRHGPLLWAREQLVYVPGLGVDVRCLAMTDEAQARLTWRGAAEGEFPQGEGGTSMPA